MSMSTVAENTSALKVINGLAATEYTQTRKNFLDSQIYKSFQTMIIRKISEKTTGKAEPVEPQAKD